jgi:hypothetical protein
MRLAYLVCAHNISPELVVNGDQTSIMLMPTGNERTYTKKRARDVHMHGRGDKRCVTLLLSLIAAGHVLLG